mmetsp:Transcript_22165/g.57833  ORF Transcript_22165/g.57833 Transcript_22165/m.57833 type:complete len:549 (+) Transcript_22165:57-1703(+)
MDAAAALMPWGTTWEYASDFDENGLLYWLGTNGKTTAYTNPHTSGKVVVTPSSVESGGAAGFIEHAARGRTCFTENTALPGSSVVVQLPAPMVVTRYTLRHGYSHGTYMLGNWNLEGSEDGAEWVVLRQHLNDGSITGAFDTASWDANPDGLAFSHFRIFATGPDSSGHNYLMMSGLELYGRAGGGAGTIPVDGTLQEIADAHNERVALAEEERERIVAAEDAAVRAAEAEVAAAQATLAAAVAHRDEALAEHDAILATYRGEAAEAAEASATFRLRVAKDGLDGLDIKGVCELLQQLGTAVPLATLEKQEVTGIVLVGLTEGDMEAVFQIQTLGERRRLALALRRLADRRGFDAAETLDWDVERVCAWLGEEGLAPLQTGFRKQAVDGEVLLTLTREDFECLGVTTLGGRVTLMKKIEQAKKQHYAGQVVGGGGGAATTGRGLSAEQQRLVLEQVLEENAALAERIAAAREDAAGAAAAAPPDNFLCPITCTVMEDPAVAADGHTYEREAIETWFRRRNTSPMTNQVIAPTLLPNFNLRSQIASWGK